MGISTFFPPSKKETADIGVLHEEATEKKVDPSKAVSELMATLGDTLAALNKTTNSSLIPAIEKKSDVSEEYKKNYKDIGHKLKESCSELNKLREFEASHTSGLKSP